MLSNTIKEKIEQFLSNTDRELMSVLSELNSLGIKTKVSQQKGLVTVVYSFNGVELVRNSFEGSLVEAMHNSLQLLIEVL